MDDTAVKPFLVVVGLGVLLVWIVTNTYSWRERLPLLLNPWLLAWKLIIATIFIPQVVYPTFFPLPSTSWDVLLSFAGLIIYIVGALFATWARLTMGQSWGVPAQHDITKQRELVTCGPFAFSRNPIYVALLLMFFGFELALRSQLLVLVFPLLFFIYKTILIEEKLLEKYFGGEYQTYKTKVPRFF